MLFVESINSLAFPRIDEFSRDFIKPIIKKKKLEASAEVKENIEKKAFLARSLSTFQKIYCFSFGCKINSVSRDYVYTYSTPLIPLKEFKYNAQFIDFTTHPFMRDRRQITMIFLFNKDGSLARLPYLYSDSNHHIFEDYLNFKPVKTPEINIEEYFQLDRSKSNRRLAKHNCCRARIQFDRVIFPEIIDDDDVDKEILSSKDVSYEEITLEDRMIIKEYRNYYYTCGNERKESGESINTISEVKNEKSISNEVQITKDNSTTSYKVNEKNQLTVKINTQLYPNDQPLYGYKAAKYMNATKSEGNCLIKLLIPKTAKIAISREESKVRTDRAIPVAIIPVTIDTKQIREFDVRGLQKKLEHQIDNIDEDLDIIYIKTVTYDFVQNIRIAYSCVISDEFSYHLDSDIRITNFNPDLDKVCVPGIHFYFNQQEALSWLGIPSITSEQILGFDQLEKIEASAEVLTDPLIW